MAPTIREDLKGSVHVTNGDGLRVVLSAGDPVPDGWTVGDHLLEGGTEASSPDPAPPRPAAAKTEPPAPSTDGATDTPAAPSAPAAAKKATTRKRATKKAATKKAPARKSTAKKATGR